MTAAPQVPDPEQPMDGGRARSAGAAHSASPADAGHPAPPVDAGHPVHLVHTAAALRDVPRRAGARAVVMTMGALHEGHATLIRAARRRVGPRGQVVVTVFVNPLQFGAGEDLDRYPRTLDADVELAAAAGADAVFAPSVDEVYPGGEPQVRIAAGPMGTLLEGASRPGHFDGVLTVVAKLLHLTAPDLAFYGQKDAQQLAVITRMAADLNFPVEIVGVPTVREEDGLALSSRNRYLSAPERSTALALSAALFAARDRLAAEEVLRVRAASVGHAAQRRSAALAALGEDRAAADAHAVAYAAAGPLHGPSVARAAARAVLEDAARLDPPLTLDYLALVDPSDFTEIPDAYEGEAILAVAAKVGSTRLIDNIRLVFGAGRPGATAAHRSDATRHDGATTDAATSTAPVTPAAPPTTPQGPLGATR
ncbi:pantoate--beta-alanine ligase [Streptomyces sp. 2112.3]|uniref:pantoate--beta-alanine ligase n=1 Tax=Streptomyces sp. 2112.3 TaxID=1881023 RepID=UPI00089CF774|nr:pantoate--beta-alanine ligase [Streptomyces sp. 2112.3]SEE60947.1 pantoate--beta-alanine ligase [Streptomyces sp. 2112.3]